MRNNQNEWYRTILSNYHLNLENIESFRKVAKINTRNGSYALKQIKHHSIPFLQIIERLYQDGYSKIAPIIRTVDNQVIISNENHLYYLTPWYRSNIHSEDSTHQQQMLKELAHLHYTTTKKIPINEEAVTKVYEDVKKDWEQKIDFFDKYIDHCERKWYMSPFELLFCTSYQALLNAARFSKTRFEMWFEIAKEKKDIRTVVNHGKVSDQHFVYDQNGNGLFISLENANQTLPIYDLIGYLQRKLRSYPLLSDECKELFTFYQKHFSYNEEEKLMFFSYFVFPEQAFRIVKKYVNHKNEQSELQFVSSLQKAIWQMKNIEYTATRILEEDEHDKQEEGANTDGS